MAKKRRLPIEDEIVANLASCSKLAGKFQIIPHDKRWEISINGLPYRAAPTTKAPKMKNLATNDGSEHLIYEKASTVATHGLVGADLPLA